MSKSGPKCTVCAHRERAPVDMAIARGVSVSAIARRYRLGTDAIYRHARNHLPPQLRAKLIAGPSIEGVDLDNLKETEIAIAAREPDCHKAPPIRFARHR